MFLPRETAGQHDRHIRQRTAPSLFDVVADRRLASVRNADGIELKFNPSPVLDVVMPVRAVKAEAAARPAQEICRHGRLNRNRRAQQAAPRQKTPHGLPLRPTARRLPQQLLRAHGPGAVFREVEAVAPVERELQEPGDRQSRNFVRGLPAVRQQPWFFRVNLWRRARLPHHLRARRASNFARLFATAIFTR